MMAYSCTYRFPNMGILHVTKKKVPEVLTRRLIDTLHVSRGDFSENPQLAHGEAVYLTPGVHSSPDGTLQSDSH